MQNIMTNSKTSPLRTNISLSILLLIGFIWVFPLILNPVIYFFHQQTIDYLSFFYATFPSILLTQYIENQGLILFPLLHLVLTLFITVTNIIFWIGIYHGLHHWLKQRVRVNIVYFCILLLTVLIFNQFNLG